MPAKRPRCRATTAAGAACKNAARPGHPTCAHHADDRPQIGRPTKLTRGLADEVANTIALGNFREQAALAHGIPHSTLYSWLERGQADEEAGKHTLFAYFLDATTRARAHAEARAVEVIHRHALEDWRAAAFMLERAFPERWRRRDALEHSGHINPGKVEEVSPPEDRRSEIAGLLEEVGALNPPPKEDPHGST